MSWSPRLVNTSIRVVIPDDAATKLAELARREFRAPRQQAAILVLEGLKRAGLGPELPPEEAVEPPDVSLGSSRVASGTGVRVGQDAHGCDDLPVGA